MKKIINIILTIGLGGLFWACNLDKFPKTNIVAADSFHTMSDAMKFRNGFYISLRNVQYGSFSSLHEIGSDMLNAAVGYGNVSGTLHRLEILMLNDGGISGIWASCYSELKQVNNFLDHIDQVPVTNLDEQNQVATFKAEAHYMRAYLYYQLVKYFGYDYEPNSSAQPTVNTLGVPLVKTYDTEDKPTRATLGEVYNFIIDEIALAEEGNYLPEGSQKSIRITHDAVKALKAKVLLCMHRYEEASKTAREVISSGRYPLARTATALRAGWRDDNWTEDILLLPVSSSEGAPTNSMYSNYSTANRTYAPTYLPSKVLVDLYEENDLRRTVYLSDPASEVVVINGIRHQGVQFIHKWPITNMYSTNSYVHAPKVARIAELYLIAAEAESKFAPHHGVALLSEFRTARGATVDNVTVGTFGSIMVGEWAREFCGEGSRLDCLKRWHLGFSGRPPQKAVTVMGGDADVTAEYAKRSCAADYYRFTFPVPMNDLRANPNMAQTPEWINPK